MYIIKLTNIYFTLNFRCQNAVGHAVVVSGIFEILPQRGGQGILVGGMGSRVGGAAAVSGIFDILLGSGACAVWVVW